MNSGCKPYNKSEYNVRISKADKISGAVAAPPSKSAAHRALIAAALACIGESDFKKQKSKVMGIIPSDDMNATLSGLKGLGISVEMRGETAFLSGGESELKASKTPNSKNSNIQSVLVDCHESGSTLRFLIPIYAALGIPAEFVGRGKLPERPLDVYTDLLPKMGVSMKDDGGLPLKISGKLIAGDYKIPGNVSSQFVSGLLFALPLIGNSGRDGCKGSDLCKGDEPYTLRSRIILTSPLESAAYVDMTIDALKAAGVEITPLNEGFGGWEVKGGQRYKAGEFRVEGDWSQTAFLLAMGALGGDVTVEEVSLNSAQGDREIVGILKSFGAEVEIFEGEKGGKIRCRGEIENLKGISIDASQIPDLVPILSVVASYAKGKTLIYNAERLRIKECDRLAAMADNIARVGGDIFETSDGLIINGSQKSELEKVEFRKADVTVSGYNDHRIVMSMAVLAMRRDGTTIVEGADSIAKSWPGFFEVYKECGGVFDVF